MRDLVAGLAKAIQDAGRELIPPYTGGLVEATPERDKAWAQVWEARARAALSHLKIPEDAGPVDVGEAVEKLQGLLAVMDKFAIPANHVRKALRALGVEVDTPD